MSSIEKNSFERSSMETRTSKRLLKAFCRQVVFYGEDIFEILNERKDFEFIR